MRVAFDATSLAFGERTGTGVYVYELIKAYEDQFLHSDQIFHTYRLSRFVKGHSHLLPLQKGTKREIFLDPFTFFKGFKYDVFHGLNTRMPRLVGARKIATVHDLFSIFGNYSNAVFKAGQSKKLKDMIRRTDHIIVPAEFTRSLIINEMGLLGNRITVVPMGVRGSFLVSESKEKSKKIISEHFGVKNPFLFFVGALEKRKNVTGLINLFLLYKRRYPGPLDLVLAGHPAFGFEEIQKAIKTSEFSEDIKVIGFVGDDFLPHLYRACDVFTFLSFEEGFGIPILEAMACGAPVLSSNTTSLPEAGGGCSWLIDPLRVEEGVALLEAILKKSDLVLEQVRRGQSYARTMTWAKVAQRTREVYTSQN